jgi:hypothetical protein
MVELSRKDYMLSLWQEGFNAGEIEMTSTHTAPTNPYPETNVVGRLLWANGYILAKTIHEQLALEGIQT